MAMIIMPLLSGEVHGKVGQIVFFKRYGVQLARIRTKPINPNTPKQMAVRSNLAGTSKLWKGEGTITLKKYNPADQTWEDVTIEEGLSDTEREAWMEEARRRGKPLPFARLLFIGENAKRLAEGMDIKRVP
jgi:hypothetical protein